jgi:hypothetical protein
MEEMLLRDPAVYPSEEVLKEVLGESYDAFTELMSALSVPALSVGREWRYYNDGKAWLCKNVWKKKTVFWLSVWNGYFKAGFYFTEKTAAGIGQLEIGAEIKKGLTEAKHIGKLIPLSFVITESSQLHDLLSVAEYKISVL